MLRSRRRAASGPARTSSCHGAQVVFLTRRPRRFHGGGGRLGAAPKEFYELGALARAPIALLRVFLHGDEHPGDRARAEVELLIHPVEARGDLILTQLRILNDARLRS